jgi:hypothetical protein
MYYINHKFFVISELGLIQPKDSPPLLTYLLLQRFYTPTVQWQPLPFVRPTLEVNYNEIAAKLEKPRCKQYNLPEEIPTLTETTDIPFTPICVHEKQTALLTLATTMYERRDKMFIFNNTITMWPKVRGLKPVLFLTPLDKNDPSMVRLIVTACNTGWDVLVAPHCNNDTYPVLRSMWQIILRNYESYFYGYTNGDMLFDETLPLTLSHIITHEPDILSQKHFICGQRHNTFVSTQYA